MPGFLRPLLSRGGLEGGRELGSKRDTPEQQALTQGCSVTL
jgi:hypothetical protein